MEKIGGIMNTSMLLLLDLINLTFPGILESAVFRYQKDEHRFSLYSDAYMYLRSPLIKELTDKYKKQHRRRQQLNSLLTKYNDVASPLGCVNGFIDSAPSNTPYIKIGLLISEKEEEILNLTPLGNSANSVTSVALSETVVYKDEIVALCHRTGADMQVTVMNTDGYLEAAVEAWKRTEGL
jgi:hypothetical protein